MKPKLDFSILGENAPDISPVDARKDEREYKTMADPQNAPETPPDAPQGIYSKLEREEREKAAIKEAAARQMEVYRAHQDAIKRGGMLMCEITKGITAGTDPLILLLKACEVIGSMTGDTVFYKQNRQNLIAIYGAGLLEPAPLQMELDEVRRRLTMLTRPDLDNEPPDSRARIYRAAKAHRERASLLQAKIDKATQDTRATKDT